MNFLQICQKVREKVGVAGLGPASVVGQAGAHLRIVSCVAEAYSEIQGLRRDWKFMVKTGSLAITNGSGSVSLATIVAANSTYGRPLLLKYSDGGRMVQKTYAEWERLSYDVGTSTGKPGYWTEDPDRAIVLYPIPDANYTAILRFRRAAHEMSVNTDEPIIPEEFHNALVYRAALIYAELDEALDLQKIIYPEFQTWMRRLESSELPEVTQ